MSIFRMLGAVALLALLIAYGRWRSPINKFLVGSGTWLGRFAVDPKTCGVAQEFFLEAAVLWFVFPLLDTLYDKRNASPTLIHEAYWASFIFFVFAVVLSHASKPTKED